MHEHTSTQQFNVLVCLCMAKKHLSDLMTSKTLHFDNMCFVLLYLILLMVNRNLFWFNYVNYIIVYNLFNCINLKWHDILHIISQEMKTQLRLSTVLSKLFVGNASKRLHSWKLDVFTLIILETSHSELKSLLEYCLKLVIYTSVNYLNYK